MAMSEAAGFIILIEVTGLSLAFLAGAGMLWSLLDPCWKISSQDISVQPYDVCYGLWVGCTIPSDGSWICDGFGAKTVIDLNSPSRTHICRASLICGFVLCVTSLLLGSIGSQCCRTNKLNKIVKLKLKCLACVLFIIEALLAGIAGSWYLVEIYRERIWFHNSINPGVGYTIGRGVWISLGSALLCFISALCFCTCCNRKDEVREEYTTPNHRFNFKDHAKYEHRSEYI